MAPNPTRTKILATIGPASFDRFSELISAGIDGARINMSHVRDYGVTRGHIERLRELDPALFIIADLQGPKIRLGEFEKMAISQGQEITFAPQAQCPAGCIPIQYADFAHYISPDRLIRIDDGKVQLKVTSVEGQLVTGRVEVGEALEPRKGVNVPYVRMPLPFLSDKDAKDLEFLRTVKVDYVSGSFTGNVQDVRALQKELVGTGIKTIAKIETREGVENIDAIASEADAVMVARGDLAMETDITEVPSYQKRIIRACNAKAKPVITATQMLEGMLAGLEPTRAEATDIYNAVRDGTDVVMLSGETSVGKYPVEAVKTMDRILRVSERDFVADGLGQEMGKRTYLAPTGPLDPADIICQAAYLASESGTIKAIVVATLDGASAHKISQMRPRVPIYVQTTDLQRTRQLGMLWGVETVPGINRLMAVEDVERVLTKIMGLEPGNAYATTWGLGGGSVSPKFGIEKVRPA